jgi:hypothetical protein
MSNEYKALKLFNIKSFLSNGYSSDQYKLEILKFTTQNEANKLIESLTENAGLNRKLKEAQLNFNTKKPTWKERNWFVIAFIAFFIGIAADIGKEAIKHKLWPDKVKVESKSQTQGKTDTIPSQ